MERLVVVRGNKVGYNEVVGKVLGELAIQDDLAD